jgi:hypothetical protein
MKCPQLYDVISWGKGRKSHNRYYLCRLTGQACLVDSGEGEHCMRRIWYDGEIARKSGMVKCLRQNKWPPAGCEPRAPGDGLQTPFL